MENKLKPKRIKSSKGLSPFGEIHKLDYKHNKNVKYIREKINSVTEKDKINSGCFNDVMKVGDKLVLRRPYSQHQQDDDKIPDKKDHNKIFNALFTSSLLKACGEPTLTIGKIDNILYMDQATSDLNRKYCSIKKKLDEGKKFAELEEGEQQIVFLFYVLDSINTADLPDPNLIALLNRTTNIIDGLCKFYNLVVGNNAENVQELMSKLKVFFTSKNMQIIVRHFCKVLLLQMFDRKPSNLLIVRNNDQDHFVETDFDDTDEMKCLFGRAKDDYIQKRFNFKIDVIVESMEMLYNMLDKIGKQEEFTKLLKDVVTQFTFTPSKIETMILDIAKTNKCFNMSTKQLVDGISKKLDDWKQMCKDDGLVVKIISLLLDKDNSISEPDKFDELSIFLTSLRTTHKNLNDFDPKKISTIIELADRQQDFDKGHISSKLRTKTVPAVKNVKISNNNEPFCGLCKGCPCFV